MLFLQKKQRLNVREQKKQLRCNGNETALLIKRGNMPGDSAETVSPLLKLLLKKVIKNFY